MNRTNLSPAERDFRPRTAQLVHDNWLLRGTLSVRGRKCGKATCHCANAESLLHRLIRCAEIVFDLSSEVRDKATDGRQQPRTPAPLVLKSAFAMFWARLGSLHALETISTARYWKRWLSGAITSADNMGRGHAVIDAGQPRDGLHHIYICLKRNKALPLNLGLGVAVLDAHE